jgi:hypothetical protein
MPVPLRALEGAGMARPWEVDPDAQFERRLGKTAAELGESRTNNDCPDIWRLSTGDIAIVGRDVTTAFAHRLPADMRIGSDERLITHHCSLVSFTDHR